MKTRLIVAVILALTISFEASAQEKSSNSNVCWPLHFAGITAGVNNDDQVVRLLGQGLFNKNTGDTGGRIYIDKNHTASLQVVCYTDRIVGDITLSAGIDSISPKLQKKAVSLYFDPREGFGNWHALHLGSTEDEVIKNLGAPENKDKDGGWRYLTNCTCEIQDYFTIYFKNGRINKVVFSAPAG
jgi:hypothetical protein